MAPYALPQITRFAKMVLPVFAGLALGLVLRELTWPLLEDYLLLRLGVIGGFIAALLILCVCYAYDRERVVQATRGAATTIFLAATALSVVSIACFVSDEVKKDILLGLAIVFFTGLPCWLYLQFILGQRKTIWTEYAGANQSSGGLG